MNQTVQTEVKRYLFMVVGCFSYALAFNLFLIPNNVVTGGVTGLSTLVNILCGGAVGVGIISIAFNLPILLLGLRSQGLTFILRCFLTIAVLGLFLDGMNGLPVITDDPLMASIYGGIAQGIGIGLFCRYNVSSGGTELLARVLMPLFPGISLANLLAVLDGAIVLIGSLVLGNPENVLRALIVIYLSSKVSDLIITGLDYAKMVHIITEKPEEVADALLKSSPRGVTEISGRGMYTRSRKNVLMTVVKNQQLLQLRRVVSEADPTAFIIVSDTTEVLGKGWKQL